MITYVEIRTLTVYSNGKKVGIIKGIKGEWQFFPKGGYPGGEVFKTLEECKRSLEL
jgi:hypothetical protein